MNEVAATGNYSEELKTGVITPIQKKSTLIDHLPLTMLTILITGRIWEHLKQRIPHDQVTYQGRRSAAVGNENTP